MRPITKLQIEFEGKPQPLLIREGDASDINFVTNSWVRGYRKNSPMMEMIPQQVYSSSQYPLVIRLLQRASLIVACNIDNPGQIFGWACVEEIGPGEKAIHFIYVKSAFRNIGIGTALLRQAMGANVTYYTHQTCMTQYLNKQRLCVFNPYLVIGEVNGHDKSQISHASARA